MHCTVSVSPLRLRYAMCTISNWPRAHPTELCSSNSHLTAFVRQHAPDVRLVTKEENGMTSASRDCLLPAAPPVTAGRSERPC